MELYYEGFSNTTLWPLFHDFLDRCQFQPETWEMYCRINQKFAQVTLEQSSAQDLIWVQDYHLLLVGKYLSQQKYRGKTAFFLHIPFPPWDLFMRLPWRTELIEGLLHYDLVGFQTERDRWNFIRCARRLFPSASAMRANDRATTSGSVFRRTAARLSMWNSIGEGDGKG